MYFLYSLLFTIGLILTSPYYLWRLRARSGGSKGSVGWRERFGLLPIEPPVPIPDSRLPSPGSGSIWVHAVSVGETLAVLPLVKELRQLYPDRRIFLSHVTPAGRQASEVKLPDVEGRFYLPLDWRWATDRAVARVRPALLVVVETELWPNLLRAARQSGAKIALVNARLSERSFRGYRVARPFMKRVLENIDWIGAQSAGDAERFLKLGAPPERVEVSGNVKFDAAASGLGNRDSGLATRDSGKDKEDPIFQFLNPKPRNSKSISGLDNGTKSPIPIPETRVPSPESRAPIFVAASTMPGEEALLLPTWSAIRQIYPKALMIVAPRHPARGDQVAQLLSSNGLSFVRRTAIRNGQSREAPEVEILLLDTIGELAGIFAFADLVFMGGSLVPTGGHNLLEPAYWSKPILFGPHMQNFRDVTSLFLNAGAAVQVRDAAEFEAVALKLLADEPRRNRMGKAARALLDREAGATERILNRLRPWLAEKNLVI